VGNDEALRQQADLTYTVGSTKEDRRRMDPTLVKAALAKYCPGIDDDALEYFTAIVLDTGIQELIPFLESYSFAANSDEAEDLCGKIDRMVNGSNSALHKHVAINDGVKILDSTIKLQTTLLSADEQARVDTLWGFDKIRDKRNETIELNEAGSARYERKALKEQKKWLEELESKFIGDEDVDPTNISTMILPDFTGNSREKDIHVSNFNITYGGNLLLENADLRLVYGRRYGLIGRNGIGKTTLLKHMAMHDIEGFPKHHRVLHVKQEVKSSGDNVLKVVLDSDVERKSLITRLEKLNQELQAPDTSVQSVENIMANISEIQERMNIIGVHTAESRAAMILHGLGFTEAMQMSSTDSLSGGWRMRVALAGALFIEPDLLMLDEPTNHLDLEAVLWLQNYLQSYPHTVLLVSHDKAFLNDVCTDIMLFKKLKLTYYRGNYDAFEKAYHEARLVQQRQHEAQMVKVQHMQEFVDKFRYNAKRASLVQSRIKAIEREVVVEAVEEDDKPFNFEFPDVGVLGRPVIEIEGVTFGYDKNNILFRDVHLGIDQKSRIALVGPNGAGKSTLLNLIQSKIAPLDGYIHVNGQLRLGIFTQYHLDSFDLTLSPLQNMLIKWPKAIEADLRAHLGKYEITGNDALKPMKFSSGGQKSRVAFATLTYSKPHVVILDEPTNHLDMQAIDALAHALKTFTGGVLVISHDQHFITSVCNEIWLVGNEKIVQFDGNFNDYKKIVLQNVTKTLSK
jgi:ATP-binding cassette subfamily F protein 3